MAGVGHANGHDVIRAEYDRRISDWLPKAIQLQGCRSFQQTAIRMQDPCYQCEVGIEFGTCVLNHLLKGETPADFSLPNTPSMIKSLRKSVDADFMLSTEKSRLGVRKMFEALPTVAARYAERLIPFIHASLKRDILIEKRLPTFSLGKFHAFTGKRSEALVVISIERFLRKHRKELATTFGVHVEVFRRAFEYYGRSLDRQQIITEVLTERGATIDELTEAVADTQLLRKIESLDKQEREALYPKTNKLLCGQTEDGGVFIKISFEIDPEVARANRANLFAGELTHLDTENDRPVLFLTHPAIHPYRVVSFPSHNARRAFLDRLLLLPPSLRLDEAKKIADDATTDLKVRYFLLPLVPLPNLATTDLLLRLWEQEVFKPSLTQV